MELTEYPYDIRPKHWALASDFGQAMGVAGQMARNGATEMVIIDRRTGETLAEFDTSGELVS